VGDEFQGRARSAPGAESARGRAQVRRRADRGAGDIARRRAGRCRESRSPRAAGLSGAPKQAAAPLVHSGAKPPSLRRDGNVPRASSTAGGQGHRRAGATRPVPILMYHVINPPAVGGRRFPSLYVPADEFPRRRWRRSGSAGWHAVTNGSACAPNWSRGVPLGPRQARRDHVRQRLTPPSTPTRCRCSKRARLGSGSRNIQLLGLPPEQGGLTDPAGPRAALRPGGSSTTQGMTHAEPGHPRRGRPPGTRSWHARSACSEVATGARRQLVLLPRRATTTAEP